MGLRHRGFYRCHICSKTFHEYAIFLRHGRCRWWPGSRNRLHLCKEAWNQRGEGTGYCYVLLCILLYCYRTISDCRGKTYDPSPDAYAASSRSCRSRRTIVHHQSLHQGPGQGNFSFRLHPGSFCRPLRFCLPRPNPRCLEHYRISHYYWQCGL